MEDRVSQPSDSESTTPNLSAEQAADPTPTVKSSPRIPPHDFLDGCHRATGHGMGVYFSYEGGEDFLLATTD